MKILIICQSFYPESFRINDIAFSLVERGHDVTVLTGLPNYPQGKIYPEYRNGKNRKQLIKGVKIIRCHVVGRGNTILMLGVNYIWFMISSSLLAGRLNDDYDVIYSYQLSPVSMVKPALIVKKKKKIPLVIHALDLWPISVTAGPFREGTLFYKFLLWYSQRLYRGADVITVTSKESVKYFENVLHISAEEKQLLYWPQYAENLYSETTHVRNGVYDVLYAGNIGPATDVETIIRAAALLKEDQRLCFHIVGDGMNLEACKALAKKKGVKNVRFHGAHPVSEMLWFYSEADAFLITMADHPVNNNTMPAKVQSYMLAGKPIFGAVNGETRRIIKDAECGECAPAGDAEKLAKILLEAARDETDQRGLGVRAKAYYQEHFDKEKRLDELEDLLNRASTSI